MRATVGGAYGGKVDEHLHFQVFSAVPGLHLDLGGSALPRSTACPSRHRRLLTVRLGVRSSIGVIVAFVRRRVGVR